jgi:hypothetical protein
VSGKTKMNRRQFCKEAGALGAGAVFWPGAPRVAATARENPGFETRHLVTILLGNGARKIDVLDNPTLCPFQSRMAREGTLFLEDYGESVSLHGYLYNEVLTGRDSPSQRPLFPTWNEYVRKKTGSKASDFWMLQAASYYRAWAWDVKNFSRHPDYGVRFGATGLTMTKLFGREEENGEGDGDGDGYRDTGRNRARSERELFDLNVDAGLGHDARERSRIEEWLRDLLVSRAFELPATRRPLVERTVPVGDCRAIVLAGKILRDFKPKMITVQVLALDDAHPDFGSSTRGGATGLETYLQHLGVLDELIGGLWSQIQSDPGLRGTTALLIRPDTGRDGEVDRYGQLGHSHGDYHAHTVWTSALGPDFAKGRVVRERVDRRDLAPTVTYLMSGESAEHATGRIRTEMFAERHRLPPAGSGYGDGSFVGAAVVD